MKELIKQAINTTLVVDNKQSIDLCVEKIMKIVEIEIENSPKGY